MAANNIIALTQENFATEVLQSSTPVLVDFWAQWCNPCRALTPILDELADEYDGRVKIGKVNFADFLILNSAGRLNVPSGYAVGASIGLSTNLSVIVPGPKTNLLIFTKGILTNVQ